MRSSEMIKPLLFGLLIGALLFVGLIYYATWRDESMVPIEALRDDCEVAQEEPVRIIICGDPKWWVIPGHTI